MKHYKFDTKQGILDELGNQVLVLIRTNCTKKFRNLAGRLLAERLNVMEQAREHAGLAPHAGEKGEGNA